MAKLVPCLVTLRDEVNKKWPNRNTSSDGWLGDAAHSARKSDHNPDKNGFVHAIDITTPNNRQGRRIRRVVKRAAIRDKRVWYVIANGYIYSQTYNWKRRQYDGVNAHKAHIHVSANYANGLASSTATWNLNSIFKRLFSAVKNKVRK